MHSDLTLNFNLKEHIQSILRPAAIIIVIGIYQLALCNFTIYWFLCPQTDRDLDRGWKMQSI